MPVHKNPIEQLKDRGGLCCAEKMCTIIGITIEFWEDGKPRHSCMECRKGVHAPCALEWSLLAEDKCKDYKIALEELNMLGQNDATHFLAAVLCLRCAYNLTKARKTSGKKPASKTKAARKSSKKPASKPDAVETKARKNSKKPASKPDAVEMNPKKPAPTPTPQYDTVASVLSPGTKAHAVATVLSPSNDSTAISTLTSKSIINLTDVSNTGEDKITFGRPDSIWSHEKIELLPNGGWKCLWCNES